MASTIMATGLTVGCIFNSSIRPILNVDPDLPLNFPPLVRVISVEADQWWAIYGRTIAVLREHRWCEGRLARKHGVSEATLYNWKAKYGGPSERRRRQKTRTGWKAKRSMLDNAAMKELLTKIPPPALVVAHLRSVLEMRSVGPPSADRKMIGIARAAARYRTSRCAIANQRRRSATAGCHPAARSGRALRHQPHYRGRAHGSSKLGDGRGNTDLILIEAKHARWSPTSSTTSSRLADASTFSTSWTT